MELRRTWNLITQRFWLILLPALVAGAGAYYVSSMLTPVYSAPVLLQIEETIDPQGDPLSSVMTSERSGKTYVEMLKSTSVLGKVIENLRLPFTASKLAGMISAEQLSDTQLIAVKIEDTIPLRAKEIANNLADVFIKDIDSREKAGYQAARVEMDKQIADLEKKMEDTQVEMAVLGNVNDPRNIDMTEAARLEALRLQDTLTRDRAMYVILLGNVEGIRMDQARNGSGFIVASYAAVPSDPVWPTTLSNTIFCAVAGLVFGLGLASLLDYLDNTVKTPADVSEVLGLTFMAGILRTRGRVKVATASTMKPGSQASEAYRVLRSNVEFSVIDKPVKTILVTSPGPREGKTTISCNLAIVTAQSGKKVVLVDGDLRRPSVQRFFSLNGERGLTNFLLSSKVKIEDCLLESGVPGLRLLTSGPVPPNPAELLGSARMMSLMEKLLVEAEVVIVDSPPVMAVTDAAVLAKQVDGVLLVLDAGKTRIDVARRALEELTRGGARVLGGVLNRRRTGSSGYYYYRYSSKGNNQRDPEKGIAA